MIFSPGAWLAGLCGLGAILLWLGRWRAGRVLVSAGALGFALVAILPLDQWALAPLESRFPPPPPGATYDGIIVLGGALESALTADRGLPSLNDAGERLTQFATLARQYPNARLVFTGGPLPNRPDGPPEANGVRQLLQDLGVPLERVTFESRSLTTRENATLASQMVQPKSGERWLLITSAWHMPRSIGAFRAVGWNMTAFPVGYKTYRQPGNRANRRFAERLDLLERAAHEWIGLVYYWARGWSTELFPSLLGQAGQP